MISDFMLYGTEVALLITVAGLALERVAAWHHAPLCAKYASGISRYVRRFLTPHPNPDTGAQEELQFDVITELWFEDEAVFRGTVKYLATSIMPDEVVEDEKQLFDRARTRMVTVVECESALTR